MIKRSNQDKSESSSRVVDPKHGSQAPFAPPQVQLHAENTPRFSYRHDQPVVVLEDVHDGPGFGLLGASYERVVGC